MIWVRRRRWCPAVGELGVVGVFGIGVGSHSLVLSGVSQISAYPDDQADSGLTQGLLITKTGMCFVKASDDKAALAFGYRPRVSFWYKVGRSITDMVLIRQ